MFNIFRNVNDFYYQIKVQKQGGNVLTLSMPHGQYNILTFMNQLVLTLFDAGINVGYELTNGIIKLSANADSIKFVSFGDSRD